MEKIPVIIPTITKDYLRMRDIQVNRVLEHLPVKELVFIGNEELCGLVSADIAERFDGSPVRTVNEEELVKRQPVVDFVKSRIENMDEEIRKRVRPGWYYQQFLKMAYSRVCDEEFYMTWDMDTVPLRDVSMFDGDGHPVFDLKREMNPGYFKTIENLLGLKKEVDGSFVSEHMVFRKDLMTELINAIEDSSVKGGDFIEKIINAVDGDYIALGFSEFETYGTYINHKHPDAYSFRRFSSFRRGSWFLKADELNEDDIRWLSEDYDAITFENAAQIEDMVGLFRNPKYRKSMSAKKFYETILESGYFGQYADGRLIAGDWYAPV